MNAQTVPEARSAARRFADRWHDTYPKAVDCLRNNLDLLTCWRYPTLDERKRVRTTNAIERRFNGPGPWASSKIEPPWTASPSSPTKTGVPTLFSLTQTF